MLEAACSPKRCPPRKTQFQTGRAAAAGREPAPPAPPAAKNNHGRVTFSEEMICMALRAGCCVLKCCCLQGSDCSSLGMQVAKTRGCFWWGENRSCFAARLDTLSGHIPVSGINTPSWDSWLHRGAPTCQPLTIPGRGWIHPHDPVHAANSPPAFISLSVTVTHALHLPVYRLFSQGPCGGNGWLGGTGLFAQILEGKPPEVWEQEERAGAGRLHAGTSLEGTEATVYPTAWLHPQTGYTQEPRATTGLPPPALPGTARAAGWVPPTRLQLQKVKCHQPGNNAHAASLHLPSVGVWHAKSSWDREVTQESQRNGELMTREGQEDGGNSQGLAGHP